MMSQVLGRQHEPKTTRLATKSWFTVMITTPSVAPTAIATFRVVDIPQHVSPRSSTSSVLKPIYKTVQLPSSHDIRPTFPSRYRSKCTNGRNNMQRATHTCYTTTRCKAKTSTTTQL